MAEIEYDDGLFAEEERRRLEQERLDAERQYEPSPAAMPDPDTAIYPAVAAAAGYTFAEPYQDNGYEEATPTGDGWEPYLDEQQQPWAHEQNREYEDVDPFASYQAPNYEENVTRSWKPEYVDPFGSVYQADPNARHESGILGGIDYFYKPYTDENGVEHRGEAAYKEGLSGIREEQLDLYFNEYVTDPVVGGPPVYRHNTGIYQGGLQENRNAEYGDLVAQDWAKANERMGQIQDRVNYGNDLRTQYADGNLRSLEEEGWADSPASIPAWESQYRSGPGPKPASRRPGAVPPASYVSSPYNEEDPFASVLPSATPNPARPSASPTMAPQPAPGTLPVERPASGRGFGQLAGEVALGALQGLNTVLLAPDRLFNYVASRDESAKGPVQLAFDVFGAPAAAIKYAFMHDLLAGSGSSREAMALFPGANVQGDAAYQALTDPRDKFRYIQQYLSQNPDVEMKLDIMTAVVDFGAWGPAALKGIKHLGGKVGAIDTAGIGATMPPRPPVPPVPQVPFPHEKLSGLGVPEIKPDPRLTSRFVPSSEYDWNAVPEQPKPPLAYQSPVTPSRPQVPEVPGVVRGSQYAEQVRANGMPQRRPIPESAFDEGEPWQDLEGEDKFDLNGELPDNQYGDMPLQGQKQTFPLRDIPKRPAPETQTAPKKPSASQANDPVPGDFDYVTNGTVDSGHPYLADYRAQESADYQARIARTNPSPRMLDPEGRNQLNEHIVSGFDRETMRNTAKQGDVAEGTRWAPERDPYVNPDTGMTRDERLDYLLGERDGDDLLAVPRADNAAALLGDQLAKADSYVQELNRIQRMIDNYGAWDKGDGLPHWEGGTGNWRSGMIRRVDSQIEAVKKRALGTPKGHKDKKKLWGRFYALADFKKTLNNKRSGLKEIRQEFRDRQRVVVSDIEYLRQTAGSNIDDLEGIAGQRAADLDKDRGFKFEPDANDEINALGRDRYADDPGNRVPVNGQYDRLGSIENFSQTYADMPSHADLVKSLRTGDVEGLDRVAMGIERNVPDTLQRRPLDYYPTDAPGPKNLSDPLSSTERAALPREKMGSFKDAAKEYVDPRITEPGGVARIIEGRRRLLNEALDDRSRLRKINGDTKLVDQFIAQLKSDLKESNAAFRALKSRDPSLSGMSLEDFAKRERAKKGLRQDDLLDDESWGADVGGLDRSFASTVNGFKESAVNAYYRELADGTLPVHRTDFGDLGERELNRLSSENAASNFRARTRTQVRNNPPPPKEKPGSWREPTPGVFNEKPKVSADWLGGEKPILGKVGQRVNLVGGKPVPKVSGPAKNAAPSLDVYQGKKLPLRIPESAPDWLKKNAGNFAIVPASGAGSTQIEDDDPNRTWKLLALAGLGGVGVAGAIKYHKKVDLNIDKQLIGDAKGPLGRKFVRLDTRRGNIAKGIGEDFALKYSVSDLNLGPLATKPEKAATIKALQSYVNHGYFADMARPMTDASILRDTQVRNALDLIETKMHGEIPRIVHTAQNEDDLRRLVETAADNLLVEHIGKSVMGPLVTVPMKIRDFSANLVLKTNPGWAAKNFADQRVQVAKAKSLGQLGHQKIGRNAEATRYAMELERTGALGPAWLDAEMVNDIESKSFLDRHNPIMILATKGEVSAKNTIYRTHWDNYLTTALARELGEEDKFMSVTKYFQRGAPAKDTPGFRLATLPKGLREQLLGLKSVRDVDQLLVGTGLSQAERTNIRDIFISHQADAKAYANRETQIAMRDYSQRTNLDVALSVIYPFHYWQTRGTVWNAHLAARYPIAAAAVAVASLYALDENKRLPLSDKVNPNIPIRPFVSAITPSFLEKDVLGALDWYRDNHNQGQELKFGLLDWTAPTALSAIKGMDPASLRNLVDITDPVNMALAAEKLFGWKGRSVAWGVTEGILRQRQASLPDWLQQALKSGDKQYTENWKGENYEKDRYFPSTAGPLGGVARGIGEQLGTGPLADGFNQTLYGKTQSDGEKAGIYAVGKQEGITDKEEARKAYYAQGARTSALALTGLPNHGKESDYKAPQPPEAPGVGIPRPGYSNLPGEYEERTKTLADGEVVTGGKADPNYGAKHKLFLQQNGNPPAKGDPKHDAYWEKWGRLVGQYGTPDKTEANKRLASQETINRVMNEYTEEERKDAGKMVEAWTKIKEQQYAWGLPVTNADKIGLEGDKSTHDSEIVRDNIARIRGAKDGDQERGQPYEGQDPKGGAAWTRERVADINSWVEKESQRLETAGTPKSKAEIRNQPLPWLGGNTIYDWQKKYDPNYDPNFYTPTGNELVNGGTMGAGMLAGINTANNQLMDGKDGEDKPTGSTAQYNSIWNTAFKFKDGSKAGDAKMEAYLNAPYGNTGQTRRQWADQHKPKDTPSVLRNVAVPTSSNIPTGNSSSLPGTSPTTSSPKAGSGITSSPSVSAGAKSAPSVSTARPATTAPRAVSTSAPRTSATASILAPKVSTSESPFQNWLAREKPELLSGTPTNATASTAGKSSSAKETAQAWTAWEGFYKEGKATTSEAIPVLERHVSTGGDPGPYVRRAKYQVYEVVRNYQGVDRKSGDSQRGKWFAEIKALPDTVEGMKKLAAIEKLAREKKK